MKIKTYTANDLKDMISEAFRLRDKLLYYIYNEQERKTTERSLRKIEDTFKDILEKPWRIKINELNYNTFVTIFNKCGILDRNEIESFYFEVLNKSTFLSYLYFFYNDNEVLKNRDREIAFAKVLSHCGCCKVIIDSSTLLENEYGQIYKKHSSSLFGKYKNNIKNLYNFCKMFHKWMDSKKLNYFFEWLLKYETEEKEEILNEIFTRHTIEIPDNIKDELLGKLMIKKLKRG